MARLVVQCEAPFRFRVEFNKNPSLLETHEGRTDGVAGTTVQYRAGSATDQLHYVGDWNLYWDVDHPALVRMSMGEQSAPGFITDLEIAKSAVEADSFITLDFTTVSVTGETTTVATHYPRVQREVCPPNRRVCVDRFSAASGDSPGLFATSGGWEYIHFDYYAVGCGATKCASETQQACWLEIPGTAPYVQCDDSGSRTSGGGCNPNRRVGLVEATTCGVEVFPSSTITGVIGPRVRHHNHSFTFSLSGNTCHE